MTTTVTTNVTTTVTSLGEARARRAQQVTVLYAVMACLALLVGVQWILLSVAVDGFLGARHDVLGASTVASGLCFAVACWVFRRVPGRATFPQPPPRQRNRAILERKTIPITQGGLLS